MALNHVGMRRVKCIVILYKCVIIGFRRVPVILLSWAGVYVSDNENDKFCLKME